MSVEETFAVITFANVAGLDVLQEKMDQVREEFFPGTTPQFAATPAPAPAQGEPFGYFRADPMGWTDCAADDDGAIALYERPQEWELRKELDSANDFIKSLADLIQKYETMLGYRTTNAPEGAYALAEAKGESSVNTELDLACADSTCQHDFALDPKSSIRICLKCGTPERLAKKTAAPVGLTDEERADMACAVAAICTGTSARTVAATAIEWTERALRAKEQS